MKKTAIIILMLAAVLLSACGNTGPFTETLYVVKEEPTSTTVPEFAVGEYFSAVEMEYELQFVEHYDGYAGFQLFLPADWHYEVVEWSEENSEFGLDFWPSGSGDGRMRLRCYDGMFGVCGTGLVEAEGELPGAGKLRVGYYDGKDYPNFISFYDSPGGWALVNDMGSTWNANETEIEKILGSLVLDPGAMRVSKAEDVARENCEASYDYLQTQFDRESGNITVNFVRMGTGGGVHSSVALEKFGESYIVIKDE